MKSLFLVLSLLFVSAPASADLLGLFGYAIDARHGGEMALGVGLHLTEKTTIDLYPLDIVLFMKKASTDYREETYRNGTTVCRDLISGQFAKKENCNGIVDFEYTPTIAITRSFADWLRVGFGYREGTRPGSFATAEFALTKNFNLYVRGGANQLGSAIVMRF